MNGPSTRHRRLAGLLLLAAPLLPVTASGDGRPSARMPPPAVPADCVATYDVRYGPADGTANLLDVYRPRDAKGSRPAVVWIHGGAWFLGDKRPPLALPLVQHGFVVVSINYRLTSAAPFPAQIEDCKGAVRFLRAHAADYGIDPARIGAWGESAGGHLAALLGTSGGAPAVEGTVGGNADQSSRVQAVCDWFGPTDLTQFTGQATANGHPPGRFDNFVMRAFVGGTPTDHMDLITLANPLHYLPAVATAVAPAVGPAVAAAAAGGAAGNADLPPFLIMHGDRDRTVPVAQSKLLVDALKALGVPATFRLVPGLGHGFPLARHDVGPVTLDFFQRTLGRPATTQPATTTR